MERRQALDGSLPRRGRAAPAAAGAARRRGVQRVPGGLGRPGGVDHHGLRPPAAEPGAGREGGRAGRADHPRRGPHLRPRRAVPGDRDLRRRRASSTSRSTPTCSSPTARHSTGQILEEGITEAGSMASFTAAGTSYATHGVPMLPFYIFYSMFGFQRMGDLIWAAGRRRGAGLPARRHRRAHDAQRRGPPAPGRAQPPAHVRRCPTAPPTTPPSPTRWRRSSRTAAGACTCDERGRPLLPHPLQRELRHAGHARRASRPTCCGVCTASRRRRASRRSGPPSSSPARRGAPPSRPGTSWPSTTTWAPSCGRPRPTRRCGRRPCPPSGGTACTRRSRPGPRGSPSGSPRPRGRSSPSPTT